jgi:hypothetical protein
MKIGDRVRVKPGHGSLIAFTGCTGTVIDVEKHHHEAPYYRVRLDERVTIAGVGAVADDLWQAQHLQVIR